MATGAAAKFSQLKASGSQLLKSLAASKTLRLAASSLWPVTNLAYDIRIKTHVWNYTDHNSFY